MAFGPENIDPFICTHLIYSFTGLEGNKMVTLDNEADVVQGGYQKALDLKKVNPDLKVPTFKSLQILQKIYITLLSYFR